MACLLVCKLPAPGAVTLAKSTEMRREETTPVLFHSPVFSFIHLSSLPSSLFLSATPLPFSILTTIPSILTVIWFLCVHIFPPYLCFLPFFTPPFLTLLLLKFYLSSILFPSFFRACTPFSVLFLHFSSLFFTLGPVVFISPSLSPNKINWCETIHFHIFLCILERRVQADLNLHVRERI